jgi:hypothetical protein
MRLPIRKNRSARSEQGRAGFQYRGKDHMKSAFWEFSESSTGENAVLGEIGMHETAGGREDRDGDVRQTNRTE